MSEVTAEELFLTLKGIPRNKTPGPDGYTVEFFSSLLGYCGASVYFCC